MPRVDARARSRASTRRLALLLAVATLGLAQCTSSRAPEWPELGSATEPHVIAVDQLEPVPGETRLDPHAVDPGRPLQLFDLGELGGGLVMRHYPHLSLGGLYPSGGIDVFFDTDEDRFYLHEDHMMGHFDVPIGPFRGDPRVVLEAAVHPAPR